MRMELTLEQARSHGKDYLALLAARNSARAKTSVPLEQWKFRYDWSEMVQGTSLAEMLKGSLPKEETLDERVARRVSNSRVSLVMYYRSRAYYQPLFEVPETINNQIRKNEEKAEAEKKRYEALSPEEQGAELTAALKELAGPGFAAFGPAGSPMIEAARKAGVRVITPKRRRK